MFYQSSKGPVEIAKMPYPYAKNALSKLHRDEPERAAEIEALEKHVASLADQQDNESDNPRVAVGGNNPPEEEAIKPLPQSWPAIKMHLDELLENARGITGVEIVSQNMAADAGKLLRDLQDGAKLAEEARVAEKAPLDEKIKEIQDRFNEYIAPIKNKHPGLISKAELALKNQIAAWLRKLDDEKRAREEAARAAAAKAEAEARAAHLAARQSDDMEALDAAEDLMAAADDAARELKAVEREKVQAGGLQTTGYRGIGLRSVFKAVRIEGEGGKALSHYAKTQPARVIGFIQRLADEDVKAGVRGENAIPGFKIIEERVV